MMSLDVCLPAYADAISVTRMEQMLKHEYAFHGHSHEQIRQIQNKKNKMFTQLSNGLVSLNKTFEKIKSGKVSSGDLTEDLEQRLDFLSLSTSGIIGYVSNIRRSASGKNFSFEFVDQVLELLLQTHNIVVEMKIYVMELRADADNSKSESFLSIDDMFAKLSS